MVWVVIVACYVLAAISFYTVAAKTAVAEVELVVVDGVQESNSKVA